MAKSPSHRIWATVTADEWAVFRQTAAARGVRPSDLARTMVLAAIRAPLAGPGAAASPDALAPLLARLEALAGTLGQHVAALGQLVPEAAAAGAEREDTRALLVDIGHAVGVLAGSLEPLDAADDPAAAFGPDA